MRYFAIITIAVVVLGILSSLYSYSFKLSRQKRNDAMPLGQELKPSTPMNEINIKDIKIGTGAEAKAGNTVSVNYVGTFLDGKKFDSSYDHGQAFSFTLGSGQVIQGWDQGVLGMKVGGKRKLTIPPSLAYGANGIPGAIPPNSTLVFEVELLGVSKVK